MSHPLQGVFTALVTPFSGTGDAVHSDALAALVRAQVRAGVDGVVAAGGTGEFWALTVAERRRVVETVVGAASGEIAVIAQTGGNSTAEAIEHSRHAQQVGADAVMVSPPFYEPLPLRLLAAYYRDVAAAVELPVVLYNYPVAAGVALTDDFAAALAREIPNIEYFKDSSGDQAQLERFTLHHPDLVGLFLGDDSLLLQGLLFGVNGLIMGMPNFTAPAHVEAFRAAREGDWPRVIEVWNRLRPLVRFLEDEAVNYVALVKAALLVTGLDVGDVRLPYGSLSAEQLMHLKEVLAGIGPEFLVGGFGQ